MFIFLLQVRHMLGGHPERDPDRRSRRNGTSPCSGLARRRRDRRVHWIKSPPERGRGRRGPRAADASGTVENEIVYATGLTLLGVVERLTGGWGLDGRMFTAVYFAGEEAWYVQFWLFLCGLLFALFLGSVFAAVWVRWKAVGLVTTFILLAFLLVGVAALLTLGGLWDDAWATITRLGWVGASSASLAITALLGVLGFVLLRGATPKS